jgi:cobalt-zinc-cadmium efflux system outer membrane protein
VPEVRDGFGKERMSAKVNQYRLAAALAFLLMTPVLAKGGANQTDRAEADAADRVQSLARETLTAERAVQIALLNNRGLLATFEEIGIARADLVEAGLLKNPSFEARVRFPDREPTGTNNEFDLALDFLDIFQIPLRRKVASSGVDRAELRASDAVLKLSTEVKTAFYSLQAKLQIAAHLAEIARANSASLELYQRQHEAGNISDLELANQQATFSQAKLEATELAAEIRSEREKLNRLLGLA